MGFPPLDAPLLLHRKGAGKNKHGINFSLLALFSRNRERPPPRICLPITGAEEGGVEGPCQKRHSPAPLGIWHRNKFLTTLGCGEALLHLACRSRGGGEGSLTTPLLLLIRARTIAEGIKE